MMENLQEEKKIKRVSIECDVETVKAWKAYCVQNDITIKELVTKAVNAHIESNK